MTHRLHASHLRNEMLRSRRMDGPDSMRDGDVTPNSGDWGPPPSSPLPDAHGGDGQLPACPLSRSTSHGRLFMLLALSYFYSPHLQILYWFWEEVSVDLSSFVAVCFFWAMAEICVEIVNKPEAATVTAAAVACEASTRAARRRRIEIRRVRSDSPVVEPAEAAPEEEKEEEDEEESGAVVGVSKRRKLENGSKAVFREVSGEAGAVDVRGDGCENGSGLDLCEGQLKSDFSDGSAAEFDGGDLCPGFAMTSVCGRRRDMEDAVSVRPDFIRMGPRVSAAHHFFAVYDGHGCSHVAASCRDRMHELVAEEMSKASSAPQEDAAWWRSVMESSFSRMDAEAVICGSVAAAARPSPSCRCELQTPKCDHVGSTAVVAVVGPNRIVVSNCGDSRAVLCRQNVGPVPLSADHKPDRPDELQRIENAGGRVIYWDGPRVLGVLAMSRAIGDSYLKPFVISEPEVTVTKRSDDDECLILASDGLWDVVTNEMACDVVRMCMRSNSPEKGTDEVAEEGSSDKACSDAAILLTKLALARHSADNVSVVVVDLRRRS